MADAQKVIQALQATIGELIVQNAILQAELSEHTDAPAQGLEIVPDLP